MNVKQYTSRFGAFRRCLIVLSALVVALSLAFTGVASAQSFQASVKANTPPPKPCPTTTFCGSASIAGYGPATWTLTATTTTVSPAPCPPPFRNGLVSTFTYTATTTFDLLSGDGTLVLDESGLVCAPGNSASAQAPTPSKGFPEYASNSSWTVDPLSNGVFGGLTGSGTDALQAAGAHFSGTYSGTLGP
jgi:hypothetical protein